MRYHRFAEHSIADGIEMSSVVCIRTWQHTQWISEKLRYSICMCMCMNTETMKYWTTDRVRRARQGKRKICSLCIHSRQTHTGSNIERTNVLQFIPTTFVCSVNKHWRCMSINPSISVLKMMMIFMFYFTTSVRHRFWFSIRIAYTYLHTYYRTSPLILRCETIAYRRLLLLYSDPYAKWAVAVAVL